MQSQSETRAFLRSLLDAALAAASPTERLPALLPGPPRGRTVVVGAGKAVARMAAAVDRAVEGPLSGLVVTRRGHAEPAGRIEVAEASHPLPDAAGEAAARRILESVRGLTPDDRVLCLLTGGGSALLALPCPGLDLADKRQITADLLRRGATIAEANCVRKHLSAVKGGRLAAAAWPAEVVTFAISDVPGDDPAVVASGPTVADPTTRADARAVLERCGITPPAAVAARLLDPDCETPKPGDRRLARARFTFVTSARDALDAAAAVARGAGVEPHVLGDRVEGEAREVAREHARIALACRSGAGPVSPPCVLLSGGETTVAARGKGRGGRNKEYLLALALALDGAEGIAALACDTDGRDGDADDAGATIDAGTLARCRAIGIDPAARLDDNDSGPVFEGLGDAISTGPTGTNVSDFRAIVVLPIRPRDFDVPGEPS